MTRTALRTPVVGSLLRGLARVFLRATRWQIDGEPPALKKYIALGVPHTSAWDFAYLLALGYAADVDVHWMGKHTMFARPIGPLMRWLGGIAVDRRRGARAARQVIRAFRDCEELVVFISPEGTRRRAEGWKRGFLLIARGARVPIACAYLDYRRRAGGFGPVIGPSGDDQADFEPMRQFYGRVTARHPDGVSPLRLLD